MILHHMLLEMYVLGFTDSQSENFIIIKQLTILENYNFKFRSNKHLSFLQLKRDIIKVEILEEDLSNENNNKSKKYSKKWQKVSDIFI